MLHSKSKCNGVKFLCNLCDFKSTQKGNLLRHIKSIHIGVKLLCNHCDFKATQKGH